jgi:Flp pilus assembly protein TadD
MLFDLRSRGRRRTVQAVYLGLAILMGGGLVLFGVGAGNGLGGLLNAFNGGGSTSGQQAAISQAEKNAIKATQLNPNNAAAWAALIQARWSTSRSSSAFVDPNTGQFTTAGKKELTALGQDWQHYKSLVKTPDPNVAILGARAYQYLGDYSAAAGAWSDITTANPNQANAFECLAANAYAANQTRTGDLASAKALSLVPKVQRTLLQSRISQAKTDPTVAQGC